MDDTTLQELRHTVLGYYAEHGRDLPWRRTRDPYGIVVSEVMLQQTQVSRVLPKWEEFLRFFPDFSALASAPLQDVLGVWSGLGYNRRAKNLKRIAEIVVTEHSGTLPDSAILPLVEATLDLEDPREWYFALMDYGTYLKSAMPNPSRRSRHHGRQSKFEGSTRQLRGMILRSLTARPGSGVGVLTEETGFPVARVAEVVDALETEGFLLSEGDDWRIA